MTSNADSIQVVVDSRAHDGSSIRSFDGNHDVTNSAVEQLEIQEDGQSENGIVYPSGPKVWLAVGSLYTACFLSGVDLTIVAVAVPSLTNQFKTVDDIGWYSSAYMLVSSAFIFFFGKVCTVFSLKKIIVSGLTFFVLGSLICTLAHSSKVFILGRAVCGFGVSAIFNASLTMVTHLFPSHKRAIWLSMVGVSQTFGLSIAPVIGGVLIDKFSWRACFGINLPLCPLLIGFIMYFMEDPTHNPNYDLPLMEKLKKVDLIGTAIVVPSVACLLMALQWGGVKYGWRDVRIIVLFTIFAVLAAGFAYLQYRLGEKATIPARIATKRSVLAGMWFSACCNGVLATTEYYISIYWQGVRNESATRSGLLGLSMIIGLTVGNILAGYGTSRIGYFTPFMYITSILSPIASGLLTTLSLSEAKPAVVSLLAFLGFAIGVGIIAPIQAVSTILPPNDVSIGTAITGFGGGMGSALFISASATLFQGRLVDELTRYAPGANVTAISRGGLANIRDIIGEAGLEKVLTGYDHAVAQTLYLPLALTVLTLVGSAGMEWVSVKKKQS